MCSSSHIRQILSDTSQFHREATVQGAAAASPSASGFKLFNRLKRKPWHESRVSGAGTHRPHVVEDWPPHLLLQEESAVGTRRRLELAEREAPAPHVVLHYILGSHSRARLACLSRARATGSGSGYRGAVELQPSSIIVGWQRGSSCARTVFP